MNEFPKYSFQKCAVGKYRIIRRIPDGTGRHYSASFLEGVFTREQVHALWEFRNKVLSERGLRYDP